MIGNTTRILLVEDNPGDARLIQEMLAEAEDASFEIDWAPHLSAGLERLGRGEIDLVLLDLGLPDSRGLETFVKAYAHSPQIPFVVLTGLNDETVALSAVREGAQDYLVKGQTDGGLLLRAIRYASERKRIEEELRLANEELRREIEERRAAEMAVEAERQRLFALLDGLPAMVSLIAPDFSLLFGNRVFGELFGNWQGKRCYEAVFGKGEPCEGCPAVQVMEDRALNVKEMTIPVNGRVFNIYKYPFTDVDGTPLVLSLGIDITERKRAEEDLKESREDLNRAQAVAHTGSWRMNVQKDELTWSEENHRIFGIPEGRPMTYETFLSAVHPEDREYVDNKWRAALQGEQYEIEHRIVVEGRVKWLREQAVMEFDKEGGLLGAFGTTQDITERKRAEEALEAERQRLYSLLDGLPGLVYLKAPDYSLRFANRQFRAICGDWEGKKCYEAIFKHETPCENCTQFRVLKTGSPSVKEASYPDSNRTYQIYSYPFADVDGTSLVLTLGIDVTERKQAEEALKESERKYRMLVKAIPAVVFKGYADWSIEFFDDKVAELTGYTKEEFNSRRLKWSDLILEEDIDVVKQAFIQALKDTGSYLREYRIRTKDGHILWIQARGQIVFNPDGRINHVSGVFYNITQRKEAEEALRRHRAEQQIILDSVPAMIFYKDIHNRFVRVNRAMAEVTGLAVAEIEGKSAFEIFPDQAEDYFRDDQEVISSGHPKRNIIEPQKAVDGLRWLQTDKIPYRDESGNIIGIIGFSIDITERKRAEEEVRQSQARLAKAQRLAHLGNWEWDLQSGEVIWSEEVYRIFGVKAEEFAPSMDSIMNYVHPDDKEQVSRGLNEALLGVKPYNLVSRIVRPDGSVRYVHLQAEAVFESGKARRILGTAQDITERRIAEMRLRESEERFRAVFESAATGISLTKMNGAFITVNQAYLEMMGYREEELRGKTWLELTHADDRHESLELFEELKSGQRDYFQLEKRYRRKNGQYFWGRVTVSLVKDFQGQPLYVIGMVEDISQAKQAEEKLQESEETLRHLAAQLFTAQEDERKRISRELHDELGQALLVLKLQTRGIAGDLQPEQQQLREDCLEILGNLDQVVDNVRRLSRDLSPFLLEDLGLSAALRHLISEFGKHYQIEYSAQETNIDDLFPLRTQIAIYRIVQESFTNIGKHSQANLLRFAITKHDDRVSFLIQDNGKGFDPEQLRQQRPGMGLAAMEERARMVGGVLSVSSQKGAGTKISLDIPYSAKPK